jgi:hypothetical protein
MKSSLKINKISENFNDLQNINNTQIFKSISNAVKNADFDIASELLTDEIFKDNQLFLDLIIYFDSMGNKYRSGMVLNACNSEIGEDKCFELLLKTLSTKQIYDLVNYEEINKELFSILTQRITSPLDKSWEQLSLLISSSPILFNKSIMLIKELVKQEEIKEPLFNEFQSKSFINYYSKNKILKYAVSLC